MIIYTMNLQSHQAYDTASNIQYTDRKDTLNQPVERLSMAVMLPLDCLTLVKDQ